MKVAVKPSGKFSLIDRDQDRDSQVIDRPTLVLQTGFVKDRVISGELHVWSEFKFPDTSSTTELRAVLAESDGDEELAISCYHSVVTKKDEA